MLPYEFAADKYASLMIHYNMGGIILDRIPVVNQLKLRERIVFNNYWGTLGTRNREYNTFNPIKTTGNTPYSEAGVGVGNIFKLISIDAVWRLTHIDQQTPVSRFGVYTTLSIVF